MPAEKGLLSRKTENWGGVQIDNILPLSGIWETIDGPGATLTIRGLDNYLGEKVPEPLRTEIREAIDKAIEAESYEEAIDITVEIADHFIDVPFLDDDTEKAAFELLGAAIKAMIIGNAKEKFKP